MKDQIQEKLKTVKDPELDINIIDLGLIRDIQILDPEGPHMTPRVEIVMTLTTPFCPFANDLIDETESAVRKLGFEDVRIELSFNPPWEPPEELRAQMGL